MQRPDIEPVLHDNALKILKKQLYLWPRSDGTQETPAEMFWRVATNVASAESKWQNDGSPKHEEWAIKFYEAMATLKFMPNTPTLMNAGKPNGQLAACFVLPIDDSIESIYDTLKAGAMVQASGGGTGYSGARLRCRGSKVGSTGKVSGGSMSFLKLFDDSSKDVITQGAARKGANMWVTPDSHMDVEEFIDIKLKDGDISQFNISVGVTDKFMQAVVSDSDWDLYDPKGHVKPKTIKARNLWNKIIDNAWRNGEPGVLFLDTANRSNPTPQLGKFEATNPCFAGGTRILMEDGYHLIEEIWDVTGREEYETVDMQALLNKVINRNGIAKATKIYRTSKSSPVFQVTFDSGQTIRVTSNHSFIKIDNTKVKTCDLNVGDEVHISDPSNLHIGDFDYPEYATLAGWVIGDGSLSIHGDRQQYQRANVTMWNSDIDEIGAVLQDLVHTVYYKSTKSTLQNINTQPIVGKLQTGFEYKRGYVTSDVLGRLLKEDGIVAGGHKHGVPMSIWRGNSATISAFLRGLFSADGSVQTSESKSTISIRLSHSAFTTKFLDDVQLLLLRLGIKCKIHAERRPAGTHMMNDGKGGLKEYNRKPNHEIIVSGIKYCTMFIERVGFLQDSKNTKALYWFEQHSGSNNSDVKMTTFVTSIEYVGDEATYCLTEPLDNEVVANGIVIGQCGEQYLLPWEACTLGHINLGKFVSDGVIDTDGIAAMAALAVRFLDDVVENNYYPLPQIEKAHKYGNRKIGVGVMGFADMLIKLGIWYDDNVARAIAHEVAGVIEQATDRESVRLASERGSFNNYVGSALEQKFPHGIRNACRRTVAPTGTSAIIANASTGIEPLFGLVMVRKQAGLELTEVHHLLEEYLRGKLKLTLDQYADVIKYISNNGTLIGAPNIDAVDAALFMQANDVDPEDHVLMQAAWQGHVDNAVSKTINMAKTATIQDVEKAYMLAWREGCKGITVYRDQSRAGQVLNLTSTMVTDKTPTLSPDAVALYLKSLPDAELARLGVKAIVADAVLASPTERSRVTKGGARKIPTGCGDAFIFIGNGPDGNVDDVMGRLGKSGGCASAWWEALCRVSSVALRHGVPPLELRRQLSGISCHLPVRYKAPGKGDEDKPNVITSCADALAMAIFEHENETMTAGGIKTEAPVKIPGTATTMPISKPQEIVNKKHMGACPTCGSSKLDHGSGCVLCLNCGYSLC